MILKEPFFITSRLMPGLKMDGLEMSYCEHTGYFYFDFDGKEIYVEKMFKPAPIHDDPQSRFESMLSFMLASADAYRYYMRTGRESESYDLFPENVMEIFYLCSMEIEEKQMELQGNALIF